MQDEPGQPLVVSSLENIDTCYFDINTRKVEYFASDVDKLRVTFSPEDKQLDPNSSMLRHMKTTRVNLNKYEAINVCDDMKK